MPSPEEPQVPDPCCRCSKFKIFPLQLTRQSSFPPPPSSSGDANNPVHAKLEEAGDGALVSHVCH